MTRHPPLSKRDIEEERDALSRTLDEIHDRLSFEALSNDLDRVRHSSGDIGRRLVQSARNYPMPLALTAVGIAWLLASRRSVLRDEGDYVRAATASAYPSAGGDRGQASQAGASTTDRVRSGLYAAGHAVQDVGHRIASASSAVRRGASGAYASAADLRERITHGTEDLSRQARERVIAARTRAYEAQVRAEHYAALSRDKALGFYDEQPLVAGGLAVAVGAALGGLLPRTTREDETFGAYRDQVFEDAERIYRDERARLEEVARETGREAGKLARDVAEEVRSDLEVGAERSGEMVRAKLAEAEGKAKAATNQASDEAKTEAERKKIGGV